MGLAARTAEANQAVLAKIDAITAQSHRRITMLKQKAIERISNLKSRVSELEVAISKRTRSLRHRLLNSKQLCGRTVSRKISESDGQEFARMYPRMYQ